MDKHFILVDMDGNPRQFDLSTFLKHVNDSIEILPDGKIIIHLPPRKEAHDNLPTL